MSFASSRALAFASSAAFALVLASTMAAADSVDSDHDGIADGLEAATERTVAASSSGDEFSVSSRLASGGRQDEFELSYQAGRFEVRYEQTDGPRSSYDLEVANVVEWVDQDGNRAIDAGETVAWTSLGSDAFRDVPVERVNRTDPDGGRIFEFHVRNRSGNVTLDITIAQRFMRLGEILLTPMEASMTIRMSPLVSHPQASVGLEFYMYTEDQVTFENHSWDEGKGWAPSEGSVNVTAREGDGRSSAFLSWTKSALAAGTTIPVALTNPVSGAGTYDLYFAYPSDGPQASSLVAHRMALGVRSTVYDLVESFTPEVRGDPALFLMSLVAMGIVVGATVFVANRRRRERED